VIQKIEIHIEGTHCPACKARIETRIGKLGGVKCIDVHYQTGKCVVEFDDSVTPRDAIVKAIEKEGYSVRIAVGKTRSPERETRLSPRLVLSGTLLVLFFAGYFLVQRSGSLTLLFRLNEGNLSYGLILAIGLLASFHCVGMCGGLVVTYTAGRYAGEHEPNKSLLPHVQYNLGRVISYTSVGAILGGFGSFFGISPTFTGALTLVVGVLMILMGLSLLTDWRWLKGVEWGPLTAVARYLYGQGDQGSKGALIIGLLNGFMPCGPLQAMQLYALASGSMTRGALSMGIYALGTAPLMFGFGGILSFLGQEKVKQVLRVSGAVVVILGLLTLNRGLANFGLGFGSSATEQRPIQAAAQLPTAAAPTPAYQVVNMQLTRRGYEPNVLYAKAGIPVRWVIDVKEMSGCTNKIIMPEYNIQKKLQYGENIIEFTPRQGGVIRFSCWMRMVWGKFVIT